MLKRLLSKKTATTWAMVCNSFMVTISNQSCVDLNETMNEANLTLGKTKEAKQKEEQIKNSAY